MLESLFSWYAGSIARIIFITIMITTILFSTLYYLQKSEIEINQKSIENFENGGSFCVDANSDDIELQNFTKFMSREFDQIDFKLGYMENIFEKARADFLDTQKEIDKSNKITQQSVGKAHQDTLNHLTSVSHSNLSADEQKEIMLSKNSSKARDAVKAHANMSSQQKRLASLKTASSSIKNRGASRKLGDTQKTMSSSQGIVVRTPGGETNKTNSQAKELIKKACKNLKPKKCPPIHNYKTGEIEYHGRDKVACLKASFNSYINDPDDDTYHGFTYDNIGHASCPGDVDKLNKGISSTVANSQ